MSELKSYSDFKSSLNEEVMTSDKLKKLYYSLEDEGKSEVEILNFLNKKFGLIKSDIDKLLKTKEMVTESKRDIYIMDPKFVKPRMVGIDYADARGTVIKIVPAKDAKELANYGDIDFVTDKDMGLDLETDYVVAVRLEDGDTTVYGYGGDGFCVDTLDKSKKYKFDSLDESAESDYDELPYSSTSKYAKEKASTVLSKIISEIQSKDVENIVRKTIFSYAKIEDWKAIWKLIQTERPELAKSNDFKTNESILEGKSSDLSALEIIENLFKNNKFQEDTKYGIDENDFDSELKKFLSAYTLEDIEDMYIDYISTNESSVNESKNQTKLNESNDEIYWYGPFQFTENSSKDELIRIYGAALNGAANHGGKVFKYPKSDYTKTYKKAESILKKKFKMSNDDITISMNNIKNK